MDWSNEPPFSPAIAIVRSDSLVIAPLRSGVAACLITGGIEECHRRHPPRKSEGS